MDLELRSVKRELGLPREERAPLTDSSRLGQLLRRAPEGVDVRVNGRMVALTLPAARPAAVTLILGTAWLTGALLVISSLLQGAVMAGAGTALAWLLAAMLFWYRDARDAPLQLIVHEVLPLRAHWSAWRQLAVADRLLEGPVAEWLWRVIEATPVDLREVLANPPAGVKTTWEADGLAVDLGNQSLLVSPGRARVGGRWVPLRPDTVWSTTPGDGGLWRVWIDDVSLAVRPSHQLYLVRLLRAACLPDVLGPPPDELVSLITGR